MAEHGHVDSFGAGDWNPSLRAFSVTASPTLVTAIAEVIRGKKSNRVRMKRGRGKSPGTMLARYRQDPTARGHETVVVCFSVPSQELVGRVPECRPSATAPAPFS